MSEVKDDVPDKYCFKRAQAKKHLPEIVDYHYDTHRLDSITGVTPDSRDRLIRWYARQPEQIRIEAHRFQTDLLRQNRNNLGSASDPVVSHACLVLAIQKMVRAEEGVHSKNSLTKEQAEILRSIRIARARIPKRRGGRKRVKLEGPLRLEVERLILNDGLSYRQASKYLRQHHNLKISASYLCEIMKEWGMTDV